ncbi:putative Glycine-rich domain-containing protein [Helianthus annuus]|nr:putative Glycine-rich domain-containing protein [Helianthus annuus]
MENYEDLEWVEAQKIVISTDLVTATKRLLKFLKAVHDNGKLYNGCVLERAVFRYKYCWLPLLAKYTSRSKISEWRLVVPLDCEWIWHCHRLNPVRYMSDCKELFGIILDPCGVVISSVEGSCKKETEALWNAMYPEEPYVLDFDDCFPNDTQNRLASSLSTKYDLVSAVERQSSFYYQVSRSFMKDDIFLEGAVERYKGFLHMIRRNIETKSNNFCVPTYDIDLMWHTHQLHPLSYCNDTMCLLGNVLDHDDTDSDRTKGHKLDSGFSKTTKQWNEMFLSRYWRAGAMYMPPVQSQKRCIKPSQLFEIMSTEIMVEVTEIRSLSTKHKGNFVLSIAKKQHDMLFKDKQRLSICADIKETQAILFQCEPKGVLLFDLDLDDSSKSLGTCSISLSALDSKLVTPIWLEFETDMSLPITLGIIISRSPMHHLVMRSEHKDNGPGIIGSVWMTTGGACSGSGGCGGGCGGGGGGGCRASCGGCRSSCGD